jgi:tetratricopeptide (TPR) repeat protein
MQKKINFMRLKLTKGCFILIFFVSLLFLLINPVVADKAEELFNSGNYTEALTLFEQELAQSGSGDQAKILNNIGTCYTALGQLDKAEEYFQKAVTADPKYWRGYLNLGVVQERLKMPEKALESYDKVDSSVPALYSEAQVKKGTLLAAQGKNDEALAAFLLAKPSAEGGAMVDLYTGIGAIQFLKKNNVAAEEAFINATKAGPDDAALAWTNLGVLYISLGKYDEAKKMFETAIAHDPKGQSKAGQYLKKLENITLKKEENISGN